MKKLIIILGLSLFLFMFEIRICPFFNLLHIPCPGCGLTRAFVLFIQGKFSESLHYNILLIPLLAGVLTYLVFTFFNKREVIDSFLIKHQRVVIAIAILLVIITEYININNPLLY